MFGGHRFVMQVSGKIDRLTAERDALLAECETLRRKAAAWDEIREHIYEDRGGVGYECRAWWDKEHPTGQAITAALAAKESK